MLGGKSPNCVKLYCSWPDAIRAPPLEGAAGLQTAQGTHVLCQPTRVTSLMGARQLLTVTKFATFVPKRVS